MVQKVAEQSPASVAACKSLIQESPRVLLEKGLLLERERFVELFGTEDQAEGVKAFLKKRKPLWKYA